MQPKPKQNAVLKPSKCSSIMTPSALMLSREDESRIRGAKRREGSRSRLEVRPELVDPAEAAGLAGARQEAFGSNGAPVAGPVRAHVLQQHRVLLRHPGPLPHRLPAARRVPPPAAAAAAPPAATAGRSSHCLAAGARPLSLARSSGNCSGEALRAYAVVDRLAPYGPTRGARGARGATGSVRWRSDGRV